MKREEFIEKINTAGLGDKVFVKSTNYVGKPYSFGCFQDGTQWVAYENDEKGKHEDLIRSISEDEVFLYLYEYLIGKYLKTKVRRYEIVDIKGEKSHIRFVLSNNTYIKGDGELLKNGFSVYKNTLKHIGCKDEKLLSDADKGELIEAVKKYLSDATFFVDFVD